MSDRGTGSIVVLGCRVLPCGRLTPAAQGRADAAADAYHAGVAPRVIASGGRRWGAHVEALALERALLLRDVPRAAIHVELLSLTTYENALFSAAMLRALGSTSAVVVTCSWHVPRALDAFRATGVQATAWPRHAPSSLRDRVAEGLRKTFDARALARAGVLTRSADAFFHPAPHDPSP